jgi:hypothetical protein
MSELASLEEQGFVQNRQRDFENRYGGGPRYLSTSLSRFGDARGAIARVARALAFTKERGGDMQLDLISPDGLLVDDAVAMRVDNATGELAFITYFRVGSWAVSMMARGHEESTAGFLIATANLQADRLRSLSLRN